MYKIGGSIKAIIADPIDPAMFRKSVKSGTIIDTPVIIQMIIDLKIIVLIFLGILHEKNQSFLKKEFYSTISKAVKI